MNRKLLFRLLKDAETGDPLTISALADFYEENRKHELSATLHWMLENDKKPFKHYHSDDYHYTWFSQRAITIPRETPQYCFLPDSILLPLRCTRYTWLESVKRLQYYLKLTNLIST